MFARQLVPCSKSLTSLSRIGDRCVLVVSCRLMSGHQRSTPLSNSLTAQLDKNISNESALQKSARTKLRKRLEGRSRNELHPSEIGAMETTSCEITELLEDALSSNSLYGIFKDIPETSNVVNIKRVKVNRDLSHVDVVWGSDLLEGFVKEFYAKHEESEGDEIKERIYSKTTAILQKNESKFRTYIMRHMELRRVPRVFFAPPGNELSKEETFAIAMEEWRREEDARREMQKKWYSETDNKNDNDDEETDKGVNGGAGRVPIDVWRLKNGKVDSE